MDKPLRRRIADYLSGAMAVIGSRWIRPTRANAIIASPMLIELPSVRAIEFEIPLFRRNVTMESETSKPNNELADPKKIEFWAAITRGLAGIWVIVFIGAVGGVVLGSIDDNKFPLVPLIAFLFTFCLAVPLGLLAKAKNAIEDLQERVSELEKR
nr:hypothetical protein [Rhodopirellula sp. SM50]